MPPAVAVPVAKKEAQPTPIAPVGKGTKEPSEVTDKSDKAVEPKSTASDGKSEPKAEAKAESKTEVKPEPKADAKTEKEKAESKVEARLDIKESPKAEVKAEAKAEVKADTKEAKAEGKSKRKIKKEVSFEVPRTTSPRTTSPALTESQTTPTMTHAKPIGPPPGFAAKAIKLNPSLESGNSSSSETESAGIPRHNDRSSLSSSAEMSAWNYGLKRSTDIGPPPGLFPPAAPADPWGKLAPQAAKSDIPEIEQFDPWAENTALGIVDLLLKDNSEEASAKATHQISPTLAHLQTQAPPAFAVPSIPPPDFHWQPQITPTSRAQRSRFDFAREEDDPLATTTPHAPATNGVLNTNVSAFHLVDPGIVAAKPASKSAIDFEGRTTTGILPTPNLLAPYPLPPPGLMPLSGTEDWQRSFQALLPGVKISFGNIPPAGQATQAWDTPQDPLTTANQKTERRLSQSLPQGQPQQPPQPQPQPQQTKTKGAKQNQQSLQQLQQQQLQLQQQLQIQQHHQQQQLQQHIQQQLHQQQQLMQHQQLQQLQQQQQQMHIQQIQQRQQQIHQLQLQQQLQQLQQLQDSKGSQLPSPRGSEEMNEWFNHQNETSYKHILQQQKQKDDKSKKGLDSSSDSIDTLPKGKSSSRPPGFPAPSTQPQQPSPPLSQQAALLPPPASLPFRDPAILGAGMAYMVPQNEEHHWGYRGPPPFPLQPPHHQPPHMARGMGLVSILTPPPRTAMPSPYGYPPNATNGASNTSPPMMYAPNDILVPGAAGILGLPPGIASSNSPPSSNALAPPSSSSPTLPPSTTPPPTKPPPQTTTPPPKK
jgi:chemotaxis protein histidine kinase CheA